MLSFVWDVRGYFFWLLVISLGCWILERIRPWRPQQKAFRKQIAQDVFWLVFNGHYAGVLLALITGWLMRLMSDFTGGCPWLALESVKLLTAQSLGLQFLVFLVVKDFLEWCVHNLLHRVPWMWEFHRLHHSILELDWIGNMRFHWMEIAFYKSLTYLPLVALGVSGHVILLVAVFSTLIGHLNHANLRISWGPVRYVLNSPRMHVWHHDEELHYPAGQNFAVVFSLWDWVFGTAYLPADRDQPSALGFRGMERYPAGLLARLAFPVWK